MRKLLPPAQRVHLDRMSVKEALNYQPHSPQSNLPRLHKLLAQCPVVLKGMPVFEKRGIEDLRSLILYRAPASIHDGRDITDKELANAIYTARAIFQMPPRHVADWWLALQDLKAQIDSCGSDENKKWRKIIDLFGQYCRSAIGEDIWLSAEDRKKYQEGLRQNPASGEWELFLPITSISETGPGIYIPCKKRCSGIPKEVIVCAGYGWQLFPDYSDLLSKTKPLLTVNHDELHGELARLRKGSHFSAHTNCALLLFQDLLALGPPRDLIKRRVFIYRPFEVWAMIAYQSPNGKIAIPWPAPGFLSFWGHDIFLSYWNMAVKNVEDMDEQNRPIYLVYAWIDAATAVLSRCRPFLFGLEPEIPNGRMDECGKNWQTA